MQSKLDVSQDATDPTPTARVPSDPPSGADPEQPVSGNDLVVEDLLIEDVSIDGMCGVY
jgi:mycofactocin precursor